MKWRIVSANGLGWGEADARTTTGYVTADTVAVSPSGVLCFYDEAGKLVEAFEARSWKNVARVKEESAEKVTENIGAASEPPEEQS